MLLSVVLIDLNALCNSDEILTKNKWINKQCVVIIANRTIKKKI